jgi:hypothetical protein
MATYLELLAIRGGPAGAGLRRRVQDAVIVAADTVLLEDPPVAARRAWARAAQENPQAAADAMLWAILEQNRALTVAQITDVSDAAVQTAVNNAVDLLAGV